MEDRHDDASIWLVAPAAIFPPDAIAAAEVEVAACLSLAGVRGPCDVLDLPCGPGRHALALARRGHRVTAVDRTPAYVDALRRSASAEGLVLRAEVGDMREAVEGAEGAFHLALNLYHSFGYFPDPADDRRVLAHLHAALRPGGVLVMDLWGREVLERTVVAHREQRLTDGRLLTMDSVMEADGSWLRSRWTVGEGEGAQSFDMSFRPYSAAQLEAALRRVGFAQVALYGGLDRRPYDDDALRLVAVARRG